MINCRLKIPDVIGNYNSLSTQTQGTISKEISQNVLEKMLRLYIRVRSIFLPSMLILRKYCNQRQQIKRVLGQI